MIAKQESILKNVEKHVIANPQSIPGLIKFSNLHILSVRSLWGWGPGEDFAIKNYLITYSENSPKFATQIKDLEINLGYRQNESRVKRREKKRAVRKTLLAKTIATTECQTNKTL